MVWTLKLIFIHIVYTNNYVMGPVLGNGFYTKMLRIPRYIFYLNVIKVAKTIYRNRG